MATEATDLPPSEYVQQAYIAHPYQPQPQQVYYSPQMIVQPQPYGHVQAMAIDENMPPLAPPFLTFSSSNSEMPQNSRLSNGNGSAFAPPVPAFQNQASSSISNFLLDELGKSHEEAGGFLHAQQRLSQQYQRHQQVQYHLQQQQQVLHEQQQQYAGNDQHPQDMSSYDFQNLHSFASIALSVQNQPEPFMNSYDFAKQHSFTNVVYDRNNYSNSAHAPITHVNDQDYSLNSVNRPGIFSNQSSHIGSTNWNDAS
jgi:hypothetical protein